jgi:oligopeptide/dipeptide ABC transporter ATP-binding protein
MYAGRVLETAPSAVLFTRPGHPYSEGLLASIPHLEKGGGELEPIPGQPPDLAELGPGCPFAARCRYAGEICHEEPVTLHEISPGHLTACRFPERVGLHG